MDPEVFWFPAFAERFGIRPWEMRLVRVAHLDLMLTELKKPAGIRA